MTFAPVDFGSRTLAEQPSPSGSKTKVVASSHSAIGRPVLTNDPHRVVTLPSLRWWHRV